MRHIYQCPYNAAIECTRHPCEERCSLCGHNPVESARRRGYIQAGGMSHVAPGIHRLVIKHHE